MIYDDVKKAGVWYEKVVKLPNWRGWKTIVWKEPAKDDEYADM